LNSLSMICLAWVFWVGICRASAIDCHEKLGATAAGFSHHSGIRDNYGSYPELLTTKAPIET
jgi:hypothetical protein